MKKIRKTLNFLFGVVITAIFFCTYISATDYNLGGSDRYETSVNVSRKFVQSKTIFIASGNNYYDAICVSGLSYKMKSPILLVNGNDDTKVYNEIKRIKPDNIIVVGGINSVSDKTLHDLSKLSKVNRIAGKDRYSTSLLLLKFHQNKFPNLKQVAVVSGLNPYDAILGSQFMVNKGAIVLVNDNHKFDKPDYVIGGINSLKGYPNINRIFGKDRYDTAIKLALEDNKKTAVIANGNSPIDILLSVSLAGKNDASLLLVDGREIRDTLKNILNKRNYEHIYFVGGSKSISEKIKKDIYQENNKRNTNVIANRINIAKITTNNKQEKVSLNILGDGVSVNKDINNIFKGDTITLTFTPNEKFYLTKLLVNGLDEISKVKENKFTFKIDKDTVIDPRFERRCFLHIIGDYYTSSVAPGDMLKPGQDVVITLDPPDGKTLSRLELTEAHPQTGVNETKSIIAQVVNNKYSFVLDNCKTINIEWKDISTEPNDERDFIFDPKKGAILGYNNPNRLDVVVPNSINGVDVKEIDEWAFNGYPIINSIKLPDTVTKIGDMAFAGNNLTRITLPNSITYIGVGAFANSHISKLKLGKNIKFIGRAAFKGNELSQFEIPLGIDEIQESMLENNKLITIKIPENITSIGSKAFKNNNLQEAIFPNTIKSISSFAFANNYLKNILLPINCRIHPTSFDSDVVSNLEKLPEKEFSSPTDFVFDKSTATITEYLGEDSIVKIPESIDNIKVEHIGGYDDYFGIKKLRKGAFEGKEITKLVLPKNLKTIGENAFKDNLITKLDLPNNVISIGNHSFDGNKLLNIDVPSSVVNIGSYAFANNKISNATIPPSIKNIPDGLFMNNNLSSVKLSDDNSDSSLKISKDLTNIGREAFKNNNIREFKIPANITQLSDGVLQNNRLTKLLLPDNITMIGNTALASNFIEEINLPKNLTYIGIGAFQANNIEKLIIPANVKVIDIGAFSYNTSLNDLIFMGETTLKDNAFYTCGIRRIKFSDDTKIDGKQVFQNNNISGTLNLPKNLKVLGPYAFSQNFITQVNFPNSITELKDGCLYVNKINSLSFPDSLKIIGPSAFFNNKIRSIKFGNGDLIIGDGSFAKNELSDESNLVFNENINRIDYFAFKENNLNTVTVSNNTTLDPNAFDEFVNIIRK